MKLVLKSSCMVLIGLLVVSAMVLPALALPLFPTSPIEVRVEGPWRTTYLDVYFRSVPAGYELQNCPSGPPYQGWCADLLHTIHTGTWYWATLAEPTDAAWREIAWVINNWGGHDKYFIQAVIWRLLTFGWVGPNGIDHWLPVAVNHGDVEAYVAIAQGHSGFWPGPGQYHAIRITISNNGEQVQLIFFELLQPREVPEFGESIPTVASAVGALILLMKTRIAKRKNSD